jgi:hypothetical protein
MIAISAHITGFILLEGGASIAGMKLRPIVSGLLNLKLIAVNQFSSYDDDRWNMFCLKRMNGSFG